MQEFCRAAAPAGPCDGSPEPSPWLLRAMRGAASEIDTHGLDSPFHRRAPMTTATLDTGAPSTTTAASRLDLYAPIHKAMRAFMMDTLHRIGRIDVFDEADLNEALGQLDALLAQCASHLRHENEFVHAAIEARRPGGSARIAGEHVEHLEHIADLAAEAEALRGAPAERRMLLVLRLYRHLALFVADNFQHMHIEETAHNAALWEIYSDAELAEMHDRLLASIPPDEMLLIARWMVPALCPVERAGMLGEAKAQQPAPVLEALLGAVRPHLDASAWTKLARAIDLEPARG
jgi:hypothetical protein